MGRRGTRTADPIARRLRRTRRTGVGLMVSSLVAGAVLAAASPAAVAQEGPQKPDGAEPVEIEKTAYYSYPINRAAPNTLTSEFPPGVVCIVQPDACPETLDPVSDGVEGGLGTVKDNEPDAPADPLPPDALPTGVYGGSIRYESAIKVSPPASGEEQVDSYMLILTEDQPTYDSSSPAFRQAVLAALTCARDCQQDQFAKVLEREPADKGVLGVEACPLTEPFDEGPSQPPPTNDNGAYAQPVDCLYGTTGTRLDDGSWLFDLTFAAQAWADGTIANEGILLRPVGIENLAYGDPDPSKNSQVLFTQEAQAASETSPASADPPTFGSAPDNSGGFGSGSSGVGSSPSGGVSNEVFSPPVAAAPADDSQAPQVADGGATGGEAATVPVAGAATEGPGSAWWMWLLVPIFAGGAWATSQSLTAEVALATATDRSGAMTRLIERNQAARVGSASSMVQV